MTKRRLPLLLLVIVLLAVAACDSDQRAEGGQQRAGGTIRADRSLGPAELLAYRIREGDQLLEVLVGLSQSDRVVRGGGSLERCGEAHQVGAALASMPARRAWQAGALQRIGCR